MKLRTRLNLVVSGLTAAFVVVLISAQVHSARTWVSEEIEAANRVALQLLGPLASMQLASGSPEQLVRFLEGLGRVRAHDIVLRGPSGETLYESPPATYKAGREVPAWFLRYFGSPPARHVFLLPGSLQLVVTSDISRSVVDVWDDVLGLLAGAAAMLLIVNAFAFWTVERTLKPFPVIVDGLERIQRGDLHHRLPPLTGYEANAMGAAFNRMAQAVQDKVQAERKAQQAEARLEERRELARVVEQRLEEERRLIAHELHDEFGQSVTAIRSLALAIVTQCGQRDPTITDTARLIADEAARLYDAMHGLIPRLAPLSLDTLALAEILESLVRDWQRRHRSVELSLEQDLPADLGPSVTLAVYRVVQEGLINALRHAQASRVDIRVCCEDNKLVATVTDDGVGLPQEWSRPGHFGLRGLAQRVEHLGGTFEVGNREPRGVRLRAEIPLTEAA